MYNCYSFFTENKDLVFRPLSSTLLVTDLQHIIAMQNDGIDFSFDSTNDFVTKIIDIEKKLFSELFLGNYQFNIAIHKLDNFSKDSIATFNSTKIQRVFDSDWPLNDDKSSTIFIQETNHLLICDYSSLIKFVEYVDILELENWIEYKNYKMLDNLSKKIGYGFAIASIYSFEEGFDFCGSGTYIIPQGSIKLLEDTLEARFF